MHAFLQQILSESLLSGNWDIAENRTDETSYWDEAVILIGVMGWKEIKNKGKIKELRKEEGKKVKERRVKEKKERKEQRKKKRKKEQRKRKKRMK